jgi:hypothetical protein
MKAVRYYKIVLIKGSLQAPYIKLRWLKGNPFLSKREPIFSIRLRPWMIQRVGHNKLCRETSEFIKTGFTCAFGGFLFGKNVEGRRIRFLFGVTYNTYDFASGKENKTITVDFLWFSKSFGKHISKPNVNNILKRFKSTWNDKQ